jgi:hypothetical protein
VAKKEPETPAPPAVSATAEAFSQLYPGDGKVLCRLCDQKIDDVIAHLASAHPKVPIEVYRAQFPSAPMVGTPPPKGRRAPKVSAAEAEAHPGGREGAFIEKILEPAERRAYREDITALIDQGHEANYRVAPVAYLMVLARRARAQIELIRNRSGSAGKVDEIVPVTTLDLLTDLEKRIGDSLRDLEKLRQVRRPDGEDPLAVVDRELIEAEAFVRRQQGELVEGCPNCGQPLTAPALPHWAFVPMQTRDGLEWPVWSAELWRLVLAGTIPLWVMAYALRVSPEGLRYTAERRGERWPESIVLEIEERALRQVLDARELEGTSPPGTFLTPVLLPPPLGEAVESPSGPGPGSMEEAQPAITGSGGDLSPSALESESL